MQIILLLSEVSTNLTYLVLCSVVMTVGQCLRGDFEIIIKERSFCTTARSHLQEQCNLTRARVLQDVTESGGLHVYKGRHENQNGDTVR